MARKVFYSFEYKVDCTRVQLIRNIGAIEGNPPAHPNRWEEVLRGGDVTIERWIKESMAGKSCVVCFAGPSTANRRWINYELDLGWRQGKGVIAVRIHGLKNIDGDLAVPGQNPLDFVKVPGRIANTNVPLSQLATIHTPAGTDSKAVYDSIASNLDRWIEDAIVERNKHA